MVSRPGLFLRVVLAGLLRAGFRPGAASAPLRDSHPDTRGVSGWLSLGREGIFTGPVVVGAVVAGLIPLRSLRRYEPLPLLELLLKEVIRDLNNIGKQGGCNYLNDLVYYIVTELENCWC